MVSKVDCKPFCDSTAACNLMYAIIAIAYKGHKPYTCT